VKGTAHDEKDILGVDYPLFSLAGFPVAFDFLKHRNGIVRDFEVNISFFHRFQQRALNAGAGNIMPNEICTGGNFVYLINVDDAVLSKLDVAVCFSHQIPHQIFHITSDIAGFAEFCGITLNKRNTDLMGDQFDHVGLTHAGRPDHKDVILDLTNYSFIVFAGRFGVFNAIEMGADLGGQDCL
jgi:hypothetical protein